MVRGRCCWRNGGSVGGSSRTATLSMSLAVRMLSIASHVKAPRAHAFEACRRGWMRVEQRREHTLR